MRDYVHLHRKILTSWVFEDARRLQLFIYLLAKADEQGMVRVSVNALSKMIGLQRMQVARLLQAMEEEGIIVQQTSNKFSTITICKYAFYNTATTDVCSTNEQQTSNKPAFQEEKEGERERNVSPTPLSYKEKEKEREEESRSRSFSYQKTNKKKEDALRLFFEQKGTLEERRAAFIIEVYKYSSWLDERTLKSFIDYWADTTHDGSLMRFELEKTFSVGARLRSYKRKGDALAEEHKARLERARGSKPKSAAQRSFEQRQQEGERIEECIQQEQRRQRDEMFARAAPPPDHSFEDLVRSWKEEGNIES